MKKDEILQNLTALLNDHITLLDKFGLKAGSSMAGQLSQACLKGITELQDAPASEPKE